MTRFTSVISLRHVGDDRTDGLVERIGEGALTALANLMDVTIADCRDCLLDLGRHRPDDRLARS